MSSVDDDDKYISFIEESNGYGSRVYCLEE